MEIEAENVRTDNQHRNNQLEKQGVVDFKVQYFKA